MAQLLGPKNSTEFGPTKWHQFWVQKISTILSPEIGLRLRQKKRARSQGQKMAHYLGPENGPLDGPRKWTA